LTGTSSDPVCVTTGSSGFPMYYDKSKKAMFERSPDTPMCGVTDDGYKVLDQEFFSKCNKALGFCEASVSIRSACCLTSDCSSCPSFEECSTVTFPPTVTSPPIVLQQCSESFSSNQGSAGHLFVHSFIFPFSFIHFFFFFSTIAIVDLKHLRVHMRRWTI
jgi:hypothetical protein